MEIKTVISRRTDAFVDVLLVAMLSSVLTYGWLIILNSDVFLSIGFLSIMAASVLFFSFGIQLSHSFSSLAAVVMTVIMALLLVGFVDSKLLTYAFAMWVVFIAGLRGQAKWRDGSLSWHHMSLGWNVLVPAALLSAMNLCFVVFHVPEFFSPSKALGGDPDWLFQLLLAKSVASFSTVTTGLDGTPPLQYHWLPYFLYSSVANISGGSLENVLTLWFALFINPLIMAAVVQSARNIVKQSDTLDFTVCWAIAILLFGGMLMSGSVFGGFYIGPYHSVGVLFVFLLLLVVTEKRTGFWILLLIIVGAILAKTPFGVMGLCLLGWLIVSELWSTKKVNGSLFSAAVVGGLFFCWFWLWQTAPMGDGSPFYPGNTFELFHIRHMFEKSSELSALVSALGLEEFRRTKVLNVGAALISIYWPLALGFIWWRAYSDSTRRIIIALGVTGIIGSSALSLTFFNGHHVYFAGYASILALPLLVAMGARVRSGGRARLSNLTLAAVILFSGSFGLYANVKEAVAGVGAVQQKDFNGPDEYSFLRELGSESEGQDFLVYLHPQHPFWRSCGPSKAFQIPLLTNRPALRGLVYCRMNGNHWTAQNYYWWGYGYSAYSKAQFERSQSPHAGKDVLCDEVITKGATGYFEFSGRGTRSKVNCL